MNRLKIIFTNRIRRMGKVLFAQVSVCTHAVGCPNPRFFPRSLVTPPWPGIDTPTPGTQQQIEHLLRGGWYASCVIAGSLSCKF